MFLFVRVSVCVSACLSVSPSDCVFSIRRISPAAFNHGIFHAFKKKDIQADIFSPRGRKSFTSRASSHASRQFAFMANVYALARILMLFILFQLLLCCRIKDHFELGKRWSYTIRESQSPKRRNRPNGWHRDACFHHTVDRNHPRPLSNPPTTPRPQGGIHVGT